MASSSHERRVEASTADPRSRRVETADLPRRRGLSPTFAFLAAEGIEPAELLAADQMARRQGSSPEAVFVAQGGVSEDVYYRALARRLGLPFLADAPVFIAEFQTPETLRAGVAAIQGPRGEAVWLLAPALDGLEKAVAGWRLAGLRAGRVALTTPSRFEHWWLQANGDACARAAATSLHKIDPDFSAATRHPRSWRFAAGLAALVLVAALLEPAALWALCAATCGTVFGMAGIVRLMSAAASCDVDPVTPSPLTDADLPVYTVLVPLYHEAAIVRRLLHALRAIDYPRAKLDVRLIVEAEDHATRRALEAEGLPPWCRLMVAPAGAPRTKPRALQLALPLARGSLLAIFDAEDEPDVPQLRRAAALFAAAPSKLACLQARLAIDNVGDGLLAHLFGVEYAALFDAMNPGLAALDLPILLGGTSNHFRTDALRHVGGWDAWNVTEDADLGLRLARFGYQVGTLDADTHEEAPARLGAWLAQRRRWQKGWMQTLMTHARAPRRVLRELGPLGTIAAFSTLLGGVMGPLLGPFFAFEFVRDMVFGDLLQPQGWLGSLASTGACYVAVTGLGALILPVALGMHRRKLDVPLATLCLLPAYYLLMSVAAWRAVHDLLRDPFHWAKTEHGLARTSRRRGTRTPAPRNVGPEPRAVAAGPRRAGG